MLELRRIRSTPEGTFGELYLDGIKIAVTAEPPNKVYRSSKPYAIPAGKYQLDYTYSSRFGTKAAYQSTKGVLPLLLSVPGFEGIRMHIGNYPLIDTQGCILIGSKIVDWKYISDSTSAYQSVINKIINKEKSILIC